MVKAPLPALWVIAALFAAVSATAEPVQKQPVFVPASLLPFQAGEKLTYEISWSNLVQAGIAVLEVRGDVTPGGKSAYQLISRAASTGIVSRFYRVSDRIESLIDRQGLHSLSFRLDQNHGKRAKKRTMIFDHDQGTVIEFSEGRQSTYQIPENVQDALSSLYYVRAHREFVVGKPIIVNVHEDGKTWNVEVQTQGRERLKTVLGEVDTIKLKTYPRYEGVFQNKGEIYIWLTDDERRIPVLMKSTITIGTIVSTLIDARIGNQEDRHVAERINTTLQDR